MAEVAELMKVPHQARAERRRYVRRLIRRLEARDGTPYLQTFGKGRGRLFVAVTALERLMPWDPGTLTAIANDVTSLGVRMKRAERQIESHDRDIRQLFEIQQDAAELLQKIAQARMSR